MSGGAGFGDGAGPRPAGAAPVGPVARAAIVHDRDREDALEAAAMVRTALDAEGVVTIDVEAGDGPPPEGLDLAVVVGGDGSIIRALRRCAASATPVAGVNVGRLGFLAEFDAESFGEHAPGIVAGRVQASEALLLDVGVRRAGGDPQAGLELDVRDLAVNDAAITSGPPYRMVELALRIDGEAGPRLSGDGLIVATPIGSTAYSVSAGGPILHPSLPALVLTPVAAHSLAFRPIVVPATAVVELEVVAANEGTALLRDGLVATHLAEGDVVVLRRRDRGLGRALLVEHPEASYWRILQDKLRWAAPPTYRRPRAD